MLIKVRLEKSIIDRCLKDQIELPPASGFGELAVERHAQLAVLASRFHSD
jgi:hypothetical protein